MKTKLLNKEPLPNTEQLLLEKLLQENQRLSAQLQEAEQVISAIRQNEVDALVVVGPMGEQVYTIESAERPYRMLVEQMQEAAVTLSADDIILYTNPRFAHMLEVAEAQTAATPIAAYVLEQDRGALAAFLRESRTAIRRGEISMRAGSGRVVPVHITAAPLLSEGQGHLCVVLTDLTERKRQEALLAAHQVEQQAAILAERNRLAQELHDTLAGGLIGMKFQVDLIEELLNTDPGQAQSHVARVRALIQESLAETRRVVRGLRALELEGRNLAHALEQLAAQTTEDSGAQVVLHTQGKVYPLSPLVEGELFRIGQEAVTNALRHAHARQITLFLTYAEDGVCLQVQDDGQGFNTDAVSQGFGLCGMRERAERIGGQFTVESSPEAGVMLRVAVPFSSAANAGNI